MLSSRKQKQDAPSRRSALLAVSSLFLLAPALPAQTKLAERDLKRYVPDGDYASCMSAADFDVDGHVDVVVGTQGLGTRLYLGEGGGVFSDASSLLPSVGPHFPMTLAIAAGDFDGDGDPDLVLTGYEEKDLLFRNDGAAGFVDVTGTNLPNASIYRNDASAVAVGDVDGDGDLDLVLTEGYQKNRLYLNDGKGKFTDASATHLPASNGSSAAAALTDLDGDGDLDLVFVQGGQDQLYANDGSGVFTDVTATHMPVESEYGLHVLIADLDGDGDPDIAVANAPSSALYVNDGHGSFSLASGRFPPESGYAPFALLDADVDGDGDLDLLYARLDGKDLVFLNDGSAHFTDATATWLPDGGFQWAAVATDFDGDGDPDVLAAGGSSGFIVYGEGRDRLFLDESGQRFVDATPSRFPSEESPSTDFSAIEPVDLDGDGDVDFVCAGGFEVNPNDSYDTVLLNRGDGTFALEIPGYSLPADHNGDALAVGDTDGDGDPDVVVGCAARGNDTGGVFPEPNHVLRNDGKGGLSEISGALPPDLDDTRAVKLADLDGDGDLDLVTGNYQGQSRIELNDGTGLFADATSLLPQASLPTTSLAVGDVDGDGDVDVVLGNQSPLTELLLNDGSGALSVSTGLTGTLPTTCLGIGDLDQDGDPDLVLGSSNRPGLFLNDGAGVFQDASARMPVHSDYTLSLTLGDIDRNGTLDLVLGNDRPATSTGGDDRIYRNDGTAHFQDATAAYLPPGLVVEETQALALADIDRDGDVDLVKGYASDRFYFPPFVPRLGRLYLNLERQLEAPLLALVGRDYELRLSSEPGTPGTRFGAVAVGSGLLASPIQDPGKLSGPLWLSSAFLFLPPVAIPGPAGEAVISSPIPPDPNLVGTTLDSQAVILGSAGDLHLTTYVEDTIGS